MRLLVTYSGYKPFRSLKSRLFYHYCDLYLVLLGGNADKGQVIGGVQVTDQAAGPLYQLGHLRGVLNRG